MRTSRLLVAGAVFSCLVAACVFRPDYSRYPPCGEDGTCEGGRCFVEENVCLPECGEQPDELCVGPDDPDAGGGDEDAGIDAGVDPIGDAGVDAGLDADAGQDGGHDAGEMTDPVSLSGAPVTNAIEATEYTHSFSVSGGAPPFQFSLMNGSVPPGLTLTDAGVLTGTPETGGIDGGVYQFRVQVEDSAVPPTKDDAAFTMSVLPLLRIGTKSPLADADSGAQYQDYLYATGGVGTYTWSKVSGTLPQNVSVNSDGTVSSGSQNASGPDGNFVVQVQDQGQPQQTQQLSLGISVKSLGLLLHMRTNQLADGRAGWPYQQVLRSGGGTGGHNWTQTGGMLPPGLTLNGNIVSGTPTTPGDYSVSLQVKDGLNATVNRTFAIKIY